MTFVLTRDVVGLSSSRTLQPMQALQAPVRVVRGSLLSFPKDHHGPGQAVTVTMLVRDLVGVRVSVPIIDMVSVRPDQEEVLVAMTRPEARYRKGGDTIQIQCEFFEETNGLYIPVRPLYVPVRPL